MDYWQLAEMFKNSIECEWLISLGVWQLNLIVYSAALFVHFKYSSRDKSILSIWNSAQFFIRLGFVLSIIMLIVSFVMINNIEGLASSKALTAMGKAVPTIRK